MASPDPASSADRFIDLSDVGTIGALIAGTAENAAAFQRFQNDFERQDVVTHVDLADFLQKQTSPPSARFIDTVRAVGDALALSDASPDSEVIWYGNDKGLLSAAFALVRVSGSTRKVYTDSLGDTFARRALSDIAPAKAERYDVVQHPGSWSQLAAEQRPSTGRISVVCAEHPFFDTTVPALMRDNWAAAIANADAVILLSPTGKAGLVDVAGSHITAAASRSTGGNRSPRADVLIAPEARSTAARIELPKVKDEQRLAGIKVAVIGSNLCGLTAAHELRRQGADTLLVERGRAVGKTCHTLVLGPCRVDLGEHLFPIHIPEAKAFWHSILKDEFRPLYYHVARLTSAGLTPVFWDMRSVEFIFGSENYAEFLESLASAEADFTAMAEDEWGPARDIVHANGRWMLDVVVGRYHNRRQNAPWRDLTRAKVTSELKSLSRHNADWPIDWSQYPAEPEARVALAATWKDATNKAIAYSWNVANYSGKDEPADYVGSYYPRFGCGQMSDRIFELYGDMGGVSRLSETIRSADVAGDGRIERIVTSSGEAFDVDFVVASDVAATAEALPGAIMPPLDGPPRIVFAVLIIEQADVFPYTTISVTDPGALALRITNFSNWSDEMTIEPGYTSIGFEFRHSPWSDLSELAGWSDEEIASYSVRLLRKAGFDVTDRVRMSKVVRIPAKSPINDDALERHGNILKMTAGNLAGTTAEGLTVPDQIAAMLSRSS